ncbi:MAG: phage Gp37/Gp68 family protein [Terrimicrobiaceae bacterium]
MENSNISWTDHTFNPWIGCTKVGPECAMCYAECLAKDKPAIKTEWGQGKPRRPASEVQWEEPVKWNKQAKKAGVRKKVFCASMSDVFDAEAPEGLRARLFNVIRETPHLDWLLLTKRPQLIERQLREIGMWEFMPFPNVWLGISAGTQVGFDKRWPILRELPALVKFISYEPALGPIILPEDVQGRLHWMICGGETSHKKGQGRIMDPEWPRSMRDQCVRMGIPYFFKQWGNWLIMADGRREWHGKTAAVYKKTGHLLDGVVWHQFPRPAQQEAVVLP